jgi:hypothetical protein
LDDDDHTRRDDPTTEENLVAGCETEWLAAIFGNMRCIMTRPQGEEYILVDYP